MNFETIWNDYGLAIVYWFSCGILIWFLFGDVPNTTEIDDFEKSERRMLRKYTWSYRVNVLIQILAGPFALLVSYKYFWFAVNRFYTILNEEDLSKCWGAYTTTEEELW